MISITLRGYLGNHLFQYAACRSLAESKNFGFSIPSHFLGNSLLGLDCILNQGVGGGCGKVFDEVDKEIFEYLYNNKSE